MTKKVNQILKLLKEQIGLDVVEIKKVSRRYFDGAKLIKVVFKNGKVKTIGIEKEMYKKI